MENRIVLCIDDDPDDIELLSEGLKNADPDLEIVTANNGVIGLEQLKILLTKNRIPCLVILDINMPVLGGREVAKEIKDRSPFGEIPIAAFSTATNPKDEVYFGTLGIRVFHKPTNNTELQSTVLAMLELCRGSNQQ